MDTGKASATQRNHVGLEFEIQLRDLCFLRGEFLENSALETMRSALLGKGKPAVAPDADAAQADARKKSADVCYQRCWKMK